MVTGTVLKQEADGIQFERIKVFVHRQGKQAAGGTNFGWHQDRTSVLGTMLTVVAPLTRGTFSELGIYGAAEVPNYGRDGETKLLAFHGTQWHEVVYDGDDPVCKLVVHYRGEWRSDSALLGWMAFDTAGSNSDA